MKHAFSSMSVLFLSFFGMTNNVHAQTQIQMPTPIPIQTQVPTQTLVYLCVDEHGRKTYQNTGIDRKKGCKRVDLPSITTVPTPFKSTAKQTASGAAGSSGSAKSFNSSNASNSSFTTPYDFPKVDTGTQKARDNDRYQILSDELKTEEAKLADLKRDFNNGEPARQGDERNYAKYQERVSQMRDNISRTTRNVEALKREISNLK